MSKDLQYNWVVRGEVDECISSNDVNHDTDDLYSFITNEMGVVAKVISDITTHNLRQPNDCIQIKKLSDAFPDLVFTYKGITYRAEIEYDLSNFKLHKHNPMECDIILYWINQNNITSLVHAYSVKDVTWIQQLPTLTEMDYLKKLCQFQDSVISSLNKDVTVQQQVISSLELQVKDLQNQLNKGLTAEKGQTPFVVIRNKIYQTTNSRHIDKQLSDEDYYFLSLLEFGVPTSLNTLSKKTGLVYGKIYQRKPNGKTYGPIGKLIYHGYVIESSRNNFELSAIPE